MFAKFARFISRYWIAVLVAWVVIPVVLYLVAPKWDEITHDGDFAYLASGDDQRPRRRTPGKGLSGAGLQEQRRAGGRPAGRRTYRRRQGRRHPPGGYVHAQARREDAGLVGHDPRRQVRGQQAQKSQRPVGARGVAVEQRVHGRRQHAVHQRGLPQGAGDAEGSRAFPPACNWG